MKILAIDPGTDLSAWVIWDSSGKLEKFSKDPNEDVRQSITTIPADVVVIEMIASYGMPVGKEIFETVLHIGRLIELSFQAFPDRPVKLLYRRQEKLHLCGTTKANDASIRQALIDRFGVVGTKKAPGFFYGVTKDVWAAVAVVVTASDTLNKVPGIADAGPLSPVLPTPLPAPGATAAVAALSAAT